MYSFIMLQHLNFDILVTEVVDGVSLNIQDNGEVKAVFPSSSFIEITANNSILRFSFSGNRETLFNVSTGLLGKFYVYFY